MKAIVFGGSGFVGSHVADALTEAGHEVAIYDLCPSQHLRSMQKIVVGDILDAEAVGRAMKGQEVAYNFAGLAELEEGLVRPLDTVYQNVLGNSILLEAACKEGIKRYVFASTIYVYSQAGGFYRVSKQAAELYIEEYQRRSGLDYTILRYGTLYGRRANDRNSVHRYLKQPFSSAGWSTTGTARRSESMSTWKTPLAPAWTYWRKNSGISTSSSAAITP